MTTFDTAVLAAAKILISLPLAELEAMRDRLMDSADDMDAVAHALVLVDTEIANAKVED